MKNSARKEIIESNLKGELKKAEARYKDILKDKKSTSYKVFRVIGEVNSLRSRLGVRPLI